MAKQGTPGSSDVVLPLLFERLTEPEMPRDDVGALRQAVRDNLRLLLNSRSRPEAQDLNLDPEARYSTLGMGLSDYCGVGQTDERIDQLQEEIRQQIIHFEPRIDPKSVAVSCQRQSRGNGSLRIRIDCRLNVNPFSKEMECYFYLDFETGLSMNLTAGA